MRRAVDKTNEKSSLAVGGGVGFVFDSASSIVLGCLPGRRCWRWCSPKPPLTRTPQHVDLLRYFIRPRPKGQKERGGCEKGKRSARYLRYIMACSAPFIGLPSLFITLYSLKFQLCSSLSTHALLTTTIQPSFSLTKPTNPTCSCPSLPSSSAPPWPHPSPPPTSWPPATAPCAATSSTASPSAAALVSSASSASTARTVRAAQRRICPLTHAVAPLC